MDQQTITEEIASLLNILNKQQLIKLLAKNIVILSKFNEKFILKDLSLIVKFNKEKNSFNIEKIENPN
jgi:hypothetical protein